MRPWRSTALIAGSICVLLGFAGGATAEIACSKGYQDVQGSWIATPYCQDEYVAEVAHEFGVSVSPSEIRSNPNKKKEVCRLIGQDIRIKDSCNEVNPDGRGRF